MKLDEDVLDLAFTVEERKQILRQRLREVGIQTFDELARRLGGGLDKAYVCNILSGRLHMSNAVCIRMADLLRMNDRDVRLLFRSRDEEATSA